MALVFKIMEMTLDHSIGRKKGYFWFSSKDAFFFLKSVFLTSDFSFLNCTENVIVKEGIVIQKSKKKTNIINRRVYVKINLYQIFRINHFESF